MPKFGFGSFTVKQEAIDNVSKYVDSRRKKGENELTQAGFLFDFSKKLSPSISSKAILGAIDKVSELDLNQTISWNAQIEKLSTLYKMLSSFRSFANAITNSIHFSTWHTSNEGARAEMEIEVLDVQSLIYKVENANASALIVVKKTYKQKDAEDYELVNDILSRNESGYLRDLLGAYPDLASRIDSIINEAQQINEYYGKEKDSLGAGALDSYFNELARAATELHAFTSEKWLKDSKEVSSS